MYLSTVVCVDKFLIVAVILKHVLYVYRTAGFIGRRRRFSPSVVVICYGVVMEYRF